MALNKVGDGHPYSTISAAATAGDDGVHVLVDKKSPSNKYAEAVSITKRVYLIGALPDQGIEISGAGSGNAPAVLSSGASGGLVLENLKITNVGSSASIVAQMNVAEDWVYRCFIDGGGSKDCLESQWTQNTYVYNGANGIIPSCLGNQVMKNITCVDMSVAGITGVTGDFKGCLVYNCNAAGYVNGVATLCAWNFSDDGTAPGADPTTGLTLGQISFVNYGAGNLKLNQNSIAFVDGVPIMAIDASPYRRWRETADLPRLYGGAHAPYPASPSYLTGSSGIKVLDG